MEGVIKKVIAVTNRQSSSQTYFLERDMYEKIGVTTNNSLSPPFDEIIHSSQHKAMSLDEEE